MTEIGHNNPPAFDTFSIALEDAHTEAANFLDGKPIETQGQADAIGVILSTVKKLRKDADAARANEKRPHDEAGKAIQAKWRPLLERADAIQAAAQAPLTAYLSKIEAEQREAARLARIEADRLAREALEAQRSASGDLAAIEAAQALQKAAGQADKAAARADRAKAHVAGADRAVGLRASWIHRITDRRELLNWIVKSDPEGMTAMLDDYARKAVAGGTRFLPGVAIEQERKVA